MINRLLRALVLGLVTFNLALLGLQATPASAEEQPPPFDCRGRWVSQAEFYYFCEWAATQYCDSDDDCPGGLQ